MILRSSYTQSVFSVYPIYTEDIIERYLIKSVNISDGRNGKAGRVGKTGTGGTGGTSGSASRTGDYGTSETSGTSGTDGTGGTGETSGTDGTGGTGWDRRNGRVLVKILPIEKKLLSLLKLKNILYRENEYRATTSIK